MGRRQHALLREIAETPIMDRGGRVVGWTREIPAVNSGRMAHPAAEALLHGPITCAYVQLTDPALATRAGAPPDWREPWRCLAFVPDEALERRRA
jgi:hypothetical protein